MHAWVHSPKDMYTNAHSSTISNSHKLQTFHMLINSIMDKVRYIYTVNTAMKLINYTYTQKHGKAKGVHRGSLFIYNVQKQIQLTSHM